MALHNDLSQQTQRDPFTHSQLQAKTTFPKAIQDPIHDVSCKGGCMCELQAMFRFSFIGTTAQDVSVYFSPLAVRFIDTPEVILCDFCSHFLLQLSSKVKTNRRVVCVVL